MSGCTECTCIGYIRQDALGHWVKVVTLVDPDCPTSLHRSAA